MKRPGVGQAKVDPCFASPTNIRQRILVLRTGIRTAKGSRRNLREVCVFDKNVNDHRRRRKLTQSSESVSHSSALPPPRPNGRQSNRSFFVLLLLSLLVRGEFFGILLGPATNFFKQPLFRGQLTKASRAGLAARVWLKRSRRSFLKL